MNRKDRRASSRFNHALQKRLDAEPLRMRFEYPPAQLFARGAILVTDLGVAPQHAAALQAAAMPVPRPVQCRFLVDTGATNTLVRHEIAERAGLKLVSSSRAVHGVGVDSTGRGYYGRVYFGLKSKIEPSVHHELWIDTSILSVSLGDMHAHIDGVLGRDVLSNFDFRYNGVSGAVSLRFAKDRLRPPATSPHPPAPANLPASALLASASIQEGISSLPAFSRGALPDAASGVLEGKSFREGVRAPSIAEPFDL